MFFLCRGEEEYLWTSSSGYAGTTIIRKLFNNHGNEQSLYTPGFGTQKWKPIFFTLVVDDFGVKYVIKQHTDHLVNALTEYFEISQDW